jgi:hypothetical protein
MIEEDLEPDYEADVCPVIEAVRSLVPDDMPWGVWIWQHLVGHSYAYYRNSCIRRSRGIHTPFHTQVSSKRISTSTTDFIIAL